MKRMLTLLALFVLLLAACGGNAAEEPTAAPTHTAVPPTNTPVPPTNTPAPTNTPVPTNTPAPTATAEPAAALALAADSPRLDNPGAGFSLQYPDGWEQMSMFGLFTLIASDPALLETGLEQPEVGDGALLVIFAAPPDEGAEAPDIQDLIGDSTVTVLEGPAPLSVGDATGVRVLAQQTDETMGGELTTLAVSVPREGWTYVFAGLMGSDNVDTYLPLLEAIIASVEFSAPQGLEDPFGEFTTGDSTPDETFDAALGATLANSVAGTVGYRVALSADQPYLAVAAGAADTVLAVLDADGNELARVDDTFTGEIETLLFTPPAAGEYLFSAREFGSTGDVIDYLFSVQAVTPTVDAPLTFDVAAGDLPLLYAFADDETDIVLEIAAEAAGDFDGLSIDGKISQPEVYLWADAPAGRYTATVRGFGDSTPATTTLFVAPLDAQFAPYAAESGIGGFDSAPESADYAEGGALVAGDIVRNAGVSGTRFAVTAAADVWYVVLAVGSADAELAIDVFVDGEQIASADFYSTGEPESVAWRVPAAGPVELVVRDLFGSAHDQVVGLYAVEDAAAGGTATVTVAEDAPLLVALLPSDAASDIRLLLLDADGESVQTVDRGYSGEAESLYLYDVPAGTYTLDHDFYSGDGVPAVWSLAIDAADYAP